METLREYIAFVNESVTPSHRRLMRSACVSLALLIVLAELAAPFKGFQLSGAEKTVILVLSAVTYITYLPYVLLLPSVLYILSLLIFPLSWQSVSRAYVAVVGLCCCSCTAAAYKAFKRREESGVLELQRAGGTNSSVGRGEEERFRAKIRCSHCGNIGMEVFTSKNSSSFMFRLMAQKEGWTAYCPQCRSSIALKPAEAKKIALDSGQYAAYKRAATADGWFTAFVVMGLVFIGSVILLGVIAVSQSAVYAPDVREPRLDVGKQFVGEDLLLLDCFAAEVKDNQNMEWADKEDIMALHMIACLVNDNGIYFIPVKIEAGQDLLMPCAEFMRYENREPVISIVHGYIGTLTGQRLQLFSDLAESYSKYDPNIIAVKNEIIYWDSEAAPSEDASELRAAWIVALAAGLAAAVFCAMDKYINSEGNSEEIQSRYDRKKRYK